MTSPNLQSGRFRNEAAVAWLLVVALGGLQASATAFLTDADGISYLSLSDLILAGDWMTAVNGHWSPGYPLLLALARRVSTVSIHAETVVAHVLNFGIFLVSFGTFRWFLAELRTAQQQRQVRIQSQAFVIYFTSPAGLIFAHTLFVWSALSMIGLWYIRPDMLIAAILYAVAALALRLRTSSAPARAFVLVGLLAALGYWVKMVMFPLGLVIVLTCGIGLGSLRAWALRTLAAGAVFFVVASPQLIAQTILAGRLSYGQTGTFAYAQYVNKVPQWWTGSPPGSGLPVHPVRQIHANPAAYEFSSPVKSFSYPYRDIPAHWNQGMQPRFNLEQQVAVTVPIFGMYRDWMLLIIVAAVPLVALSGLQRWTASFAFLILPAAAAFVLYALLHAESRFLGASAVILVMAAFASASFVPQRRRAVEMILVIVSVAKLALVGIEFQHVLRGNLTSPNERRTAEGHPAIAKAVSERGVRAGSRVASIGFAYNANWARLARVQIAMEIPDAASYWAATDHARLSVHREFRENGAVAIISNRVPSLGPGPEWVPLGNTGYFFLQL